MLGGGGHRTIATVLTAEDRGATRKLSDVEDKGDRAAESMERTEQRLSSVTKAMAVTGTATAALGGGILALNSRFSKLDKTFATIRETSGATAEEMGRIREAVKGVATDLPVSLSQSAEAAKQLSYAGLSASETMAALNETSQLAVASNLQAGGAAQTVARSLNAFELEARQTDAVVGALGQTFSDSATDIQSLSQGLTEVQATANAAGLSVAETTASLGLLASSGLAGSKSGTALNATLRKLTSGSNRTKQALDELGLSMQDFTNESGSLRALPTIMQTLSERMSGVESEAERLRIANQLVGAEGARALLPMIRNTEDLTNRVQNNLRAEIQGAIGDIAEMNEQEIETTSQSLGINVSAETTGTEVIDNLQELAEQGESTEQIASRLQVGLGLTGDAAELLAEDITETNKSAEELASAIDATTTAADLAEAQTQTLSGQMTQLRSDLQVIGYQMQQGTKPAISAVVGGLRNLTTPIAENQSAAKALGAGLVGLTAVMGTATVGLAAHVAQLKLSVLMQQAHTSQTAASTAALWAKSAALGAASRAQWLMTASTSQLLAATTAKTAALWTSVTALGASAVASLTSAGAMGILSGAAGLAAAGVTALWTALGPIGLLALGITAAVLGLAGVMKTDLFGAGEAAGNLLGWFGDKAGTAWNITKQLTGILFELARIGATIAGLSLIAPFAAVLKLPGLISSVGPKVKKAAMSLPGKIADGLASLGPAKYALPVLGPLLLAKDMITDPSKWLDAGKQIPGMIANGIKSAASKPVDAVTNVASGIRDRLPFSPAEKGPLQSLGETGPGLIQTIAGGVESEAPTLVSSISNVLGQTPLGQAAGAAGGLLGKTPLGQAAGAAADAIGGSGEGGDSGGPGGGPGEGTPPLEITINQDIDVDGGDATEADVATAASNGASQAISGDALDAFFARLSREVNN